MNVFYSNPKKYPLDIISILFTLVADPPGLAVAIAKLPTKPKG